MTLIKISTEYEKKMRREGKYNVGTHAESFGKEYVEGLFEFSRKRQEMAKKGEIDYTRLPDLVGMENKRLDNIFEKNIRSLVKDNYKRLKHTKWNTGWYPSQFDKNTYPVQDNGFYPEQ